MSGRRIHLFDEAPQWWAEHVEPGRYALELQWAPGETPTTFRLGVLDTERVAFEFSPGEAFRRGPPDHRAETPWTRAMGSGHRVEQFFGKVLTVAGWHRPAVDPRIFRRLVDLRRADAVRLEFICDTNALNEGVAHWLVGLFADRCDIVLTSVTLSELQDHFAAAGFGKQPSDGNKDKALQWLPKRFSALTAYRFREASGFPRVLWRELDIDDTALLLARGSRAGDKSSSADTMMLRAVRRAINDRVGGLERFFVTGDTALARRATSELPAGQVIAAKVADLTRDAVYVPADWWPGPDQGGSLAQSHPIRLIWSLLGLADAVALREGDDEPPRLVFSAHDGTMWPSDYTAPWLMVEPATPRRRPTTLTERTPSETGPFQLPLPESPPADEAEKQAERPLGRVATEVDDEPLFPPVRESPVEPFYLYAQASRDDLFGLLGHLGRGDFPGARGALSALPAKRVRGVTRLLETLELARVEAEAVRAGEQTAVLQAAWANGRTDQIAALLRPYEPFARIAEGHMSIDGVSQRIVQTIRPVARALGQVVDFEGHWYPAGAAPTVKATRAAVLQAVAREPTLSVSRLWVDVCLRNLAIAPSRVVAHWERFRAGVLFDFQWRTGGTPSGQMIQEVARIEGGTLQMESIPLDHHQTIREFYQVAP